MAILAGQLVISLILSCVMQKLSPHFSFAQWFLCYTGLKRYLHPTDDELRALAGIKKEKRKDKEKQHTFFVSKNIPIHLDVANISNLDTAYLRYFEEYSWLVDFSIYTAVAYISSEVFYYYIPRNGEMNLSLIWCLIAILFAIKYLSSLALLYFKNDKSVGERSLCIVAFFMYLLIAMIALVLDENILDSGLEKAYDSFTENAIALMSGNGSSPKKGPISKTVFKFCIAICCGFLGSLCTFPGLRVSKMHWDSLRNYRNDKAVKLALHINFILPFICVILWIRPISRDNLTVHVFQGLNSPLLTSNGFETIRLLIIIFTVLLRFSLLPIYVQSYLNAAYDRFSNIKKEAGRITNLELKQQISSIFHYVCVVIIQFASPLIICLYIALLYKNLGGMFWINNNNQSSLENSSNNFKNNENTSENNNTYLKSVVDFQSTLCNLNKVFSTKVYQGVLGFFLWWNCFILFSSSSFGLLYYSHFDQL